MKQRQPISSEAIKKASYASSRIEGYPSKVSTPVKQKASRILRTLLDNK